MKIRALIVALALLIAGPVVSTPAQAAPATKHLTFTVTFTSTGTTLSSLPGDITYGWNHLVGKTMWGKRHANVDFLGEVNYVDGTGPFGGYITLTRANGTKLAFTVSGRAISPPVAGTANTRFAGVIDVIGGAGQYEGATGIGSMTGFRKAALGSPVTLTFDLQVRP